MAFNSLTAKKSKAKRRGKRDLTAAEMNFLRGR